MVRSLVRKRRLVRGSDGGGWEAVVIKLVAERGLDLGLPRVLPCTGSFAAVGDPTLLERTLFADLSLLF